MKTTMGNLKNEIYVEMAIKYWWHPFIFHTTFATRSLIGRSASQIISIVICWYCRVFCVNTFISFYSTTSASAAGIVYFFVKLNLILDLYTMSFFLTAAILSPINNQITKENILNAKVKTPKFCSVSEYISLSEHHKHLYLSVSYDNIQMT